jgi:hypothetical protein
VKIFPQKFFALKVGLGREELQGIWLKITNQASFLTISYELSKRKETVLFKRKEPAFDLSFLFPHYPRSLRLKSLNVIILWAENRVILPE